MKYRQLGRWGVRLSEIGIGSWLTMGHGIDKKTSKEIIGAALEKGINFFDTADVYGKGEAEKVLGKLLFKEFDVRREDIVLATKCFGQMSDKTNDRGLSRKHIFESVENCLRRLKTDYIDIMQCHRFDPDTPVEETCKAFDDLVHQGKILYWGTSEWSAENIEDAYWVCEENGLYKPVSNQPQYNILQNKIETNGVIAVSEKYGIGQVVWSPLAQGMLTGKYSSAYVPADSRAANEKMGIFIKDRLDANLLEKVDKLKAITDDMGVTMSQFALAWCLRKKIITSAIIGASRKEQVIENCGAVEIEFTDALDDQVKLLFA